MNIRAPSHQLACEQRYKGTSGSEKKYMRLILDVDSS